VLEDDNVTEFELAATVERFAAATQGWDDETLSRPWAWRTYDEGLRHAFFRTYEELSELVATTAVERVTQGPAITTAQRFLGQHHRAYRDFQAVLLGADELLDEIPAEGEWPLRKVIEHIIAADQTFFAVTWHALERGRRGKAPRAITKEELVALIGSYDELEKAMATGSLGEILGWNDTRHRRILNDLATISDGELGTPSLWWEKEELPLQFRLLRFDSHLRQHTIQAEKTLDALEHRPTEVRRLLRIIYHALAVAEATAIGAGDLGAEQQRAVAAGIAARLDEIVEPGVA
jgi:hypothetical protein